MITVYEKTHPYIKNTSRIDIVREVFLILCPVFWVQFSLELVLLSFYHNQRFQLGNLGGNAGADDSIHH